MRGRVAALVLSLAPTAGLAEAYHDLGRPDQCGAYAEAHYDRKVWFPGAEGAAVALTDPQSVRGLNAVLYDSVITEEGMDAPGGRVLATRGPFLDAAGNSAGEVLVIVTERGIRVLQRCP